MEWISVEDEAAPKKGKFIFGYYYGVGLGQFGACYKMTSLGHDQYDCDKYILCLWPSDCRTDGFMEFTHKEMVELEMKWMPLPEPPL